MTYASPALRAAADLAQGRCALLADDLSGAIAACAAAVGAWTDLGAPFEAASARLVLGDVHARAGTTDRSHMEWTAAAVAFRAFGAVRWAEHAAGLLDRGEECRQPVDGVRPAVAAALCRRGDHVVVSFAGRDAILPELKGLTYLARLLGHPGREFHALDLTAGEEDRRGQIGPVDHEDELRVVPHVDAGLPLLDDQARAAYRRRLVEVEADIDEARAMNDLGRVALAERDRGYLLAELGAAVGLGGRLRTVGGSVERARTSVTRSLRYALRRLCEFHPELGAHLERTVRTGAYCVYVPDPISPVVWTLE